MQNKAKAFKWKHYEAEIILWSIRWYAQFSISYRDLVSMAKERGLSVAHTTMMRWVHEYAPQLERKVKKHLKKSNHSYRVDETYLKIKGRWKYLYRAVDSKGNTLDWMLSAQRNFKAVKRFFKKLLNNKHCSSPRVINVDKNKAYPPAFVDSKKDKIIPKRTKLRQQKYMNNIIDQDHRFIKRRIGQSQWLQSFSTAKCTIAGYETMHMIKKGQVKKLAANDVIAQIKFIHRLFGVAA